jgi:WD40 repeat protein
MVGLCLNAILTACSPATAASTSAPLPTVLPQPTLPLATIAPTPEPVGVGVPAIEYGYNKSELLVFSAVTGKPLDLFTPIPIEDFSGYAFAPDGRTLTFVAKAKLYFIDLPSWKYRTFDVDLHGWLSAVVYSPDGTLLALASGLPDGDLRIVDAKSGEVKTSAQAGFAIRNIKFTSDGKALMVYGPHLIAEISAGPPKAALFAVSDLSVLWSAELKGIRHGIFPKKPGPVDIYQPGAAWNYAPGIAFSPDSDILYLVHSDEDKLTTVDFTHRKVNTVDVHVTTSWLDQLLSFTAGVVHAKGMDGTAKQAVISPDGKLLFVGGNTEAVTMQADTDTPLPLQVIDTGDGTLLAEIDAQATPTRLSRDGKQIFLSGWKRDNNSATQWTDVYDMSSKMLVKRIDNVDLVLTRRIDGKPMLVGNEYIGSNGEDVCKISSLDLLTLTILNTWKGSCVGWLSTP